MNGLALCSGIGGLELGLSLAIPGYQTVGHVERDAYAAATLVARMEDKTLESAPIWDDIKSFDGNPWCGVVDIVSAGFPCQPFSQAGKRLGQDDERWLWDDIERVLRDVRPRLVFLENVPPLVSNGLDAVLGSLAQLGFNAEWGVFSAARSGAPHVRKRLFIFAAHAHGSGLEEVRGTGESEQPEPSECSIAHSDRAILRAERRGAEPRPGEAEPGTDGAQKHPTDPDRGGLESIWLRDREQRKCRNKPDRCRGPWVDEWEAGVADGTIPQPAIRGVDDGAPHRVDRLRCLGNGVVPAVAARAFLTLWGRMRKETT